MLFLAMLAAAAVDVPETKAQSEQRTAEMHARADANHDGYVTYEEFRSFAMAWPMISPMMKALPPDVVEKIMNMPILRDQFDATDADHDGRWSLAEALAGANRNFAAADTDHDGKLSLAERVSYRMHEMEKVQAAMAALKLPCKPGAACDTMRRN